MGVTNSRIALIAPLASAAVIPLSSHSSQNGAFQSDIAIPDYVVDWDEFIPEVAFSVRCPECRSSTQSDSEEQALSFRFKALPSEDPCGYANITLNGEHLPQFWNGNRASGQGNLAAFLDNSLFSKADLTLSWQTSCLYGDDDGRHGGLDSQSAAQVISVMVNSVNGQRLTEPAGFTLSYKQFQSPELLKLDLAPNPSASDQEFSEQWRNPTHNLSNALKAYEKSEQLFDHRVIPLDDGASSLERLEEEAAALLAYIKKTKASFKKTSAVELRRIKAQLQECNSNSCIFSVLGHRFKGAAKYFYRKIQSKISCDTSFHKYQHTSSAQEVVTILKGNTNRPTLVESARPQSSRSLMNSDSSSLSATVDSSPITNSAHPQVSHKQIAVHALATLAVIVTIGTMFIVVRQNCCTLRQRADRKARREERRVAREYQGLARRQAWRDWWQGKDRCRIRCYEEKRSMILQQEGILEAAMLNELRLLREAHSLVDSMVRAEEGQFCHGHQRGYSMRRSESLPDYRSDASTAPPPYGEEESDIVANGFHPSPPSTTHYTPDSSVIGISPRPSCETLRRSDGFLPDSEDESDVCSETPSVQD